MTDHEVTGMEHAIEHATKVIGDLPGFTDEQVRGIAEDLAEAGLLAPAPLREEWAARYTNGGGTVCRTRDEAETELARMNRDSHHPRIDEPPAPQIAGIYARHVTDWHVQAGTAQWETP